MKTILSFLLVSPVLFAVSASAAQPSTPSPSPTDAADADFGAVRPVTRIAPQLRREDVWVFPASAEKIFPLLCPVLEYDWIPGWRAKLIHSVSGVAEKGCIFETRFPRDGRATWVCTHYEPPRKIDYTIFLHQGVVARLEIDLTPVAAGTQTVWTRTWHAVDAQGEAYIQGWDEAGFDRSVQHLEAMLRHYLATGTMLPPARS